MSFTTWYYDPFVEFNRLLDDAFTERGVSPSQGQLTRRATAERAIATPRMDLHENPQTNLVEATFELPGLRKEDVNIDVHNNRLTVSGEHKIAEERDENGYAVRERRVGRFSRTLQLPPGTNAGDIKAAMENGVLTVTFPRASPEAAPKRITVS
ncbi:hypothetical protein AcW1_001266 [Taiwanofungus camphoratus]|nr:hypothetical protein AcW2_000209 [Antrodia cinnamomea]KAI0962447.1 hypothetical protein AcV7_001288 [Antrodia cinnamomea]KAI0964450.1 hypothetical protein AcW1_001266 [Antrodia cinnamomea]